MTRKKKDITVRFPEFQAAFNELMGGMTMKAFADKLGLSRATVGFYVAGQRIPDALGVKTIAETCDVSADWLLGLSCAKTRVEEKVDMIDREICRAALEKWGPQAQTAMVFEEMSELQKELCKNLRGANNRGHIAEEIADVLIVLEQMMILHDCKREVDEIRAQKLERLRGRIKEAIPLPKPPGSNGYTAHSRWTIPGKEKYVWVCANCGFGEGMTCSEEDDSENDVNPYWHYCPNCGAKMDNEK